MKPKPNSSSTSSASQTPASAAATQAKPSPSRTPPPTDSPEWKETTLDELHKKASEGSKVELVSVQMGGRSYLGPAHPAYGRSSSAQKPWEQRLEEFSKELDKLDD